MSFGGIETVRFAGGNDVYEAMIQVLLIKHYAIHECDPYELCREDAFCEQKAELRL